MSQYVIHAEADSTGEFYIGPFRSYDKAEAMLDRLIDAGADAGLRELRPPDSMGSWFRLEEAAP